MVFEYFVLCQHSDKLQIRQIHNPLCIYETLNQYAEF